MMGVAQGMLDIFHLEIWGPVIVYDKPGDSRQKIPPAGRDPEMAQERRADHVQPLCFARHPEAGLIQMLDRHLRPTQPFAYRRREGLKAISCAPDQPGQGGWNGCEAKQIRQYKREALLRDAMIGLQVAGNTGDPRAVLNRSRNTRREDPTRDSITLAAPTQMYPALLHGPYRIC